MAPLSNENTHRPYGVVGIEDELEFDSDYYGNDYDRPGAEGMNDLAEIYFDYYFNDERRYDNPEGWDSDDEYWHPLGQFEHYDEQDWDEYEIESEYNRVLAEEY